MSDIPSRIGPYCPVTEMGSGGGGIVWRSRHSVSGEMAAVKVARGAARRQRDLFRREVSMLSRLGRAKHPGIVRVIADGSDDRHLWYAMEFIEGIELGSLIRRLWKRQSSQPLPMMETADSTESTERESPASPRRPTSSPPGIIPHAWPDLDSPGYATPLEAGAGKIDQVLLLVGQLAATLSQLHGEGVVHGDVTPGNVVVRPTLAPVLVDFGTAFYISTGSRAREIAQVEGLVLGTPGYMAPEQIRGDSLDARCDLYALGCILYELLTGRLPFIADEIAALNRQHLHVPPTPPSAWVRGIPAELDELALDLLQKEPRQRLGRAHDVVLRLGRVYRGTEPFPSSQPSLSLYRSRLAGRNEPIEWLEGLLRRACDSVGGSVLVCGDSGVGKTRFLNELSARAVEMGMEVVTGQCAGIEDVEGNSVVRGPALHGFAPFLQHLADHVRDRSHVVAGLGDDLLILAPYEPNLRDALPTRAESIPPLTAKVAAVRVVGSLAQCLVRLGQERPLLLILDDLQWADELTVSFWTSVKASELARSSVLVVGACRDREADPRLRSWISNHPQRCRALTLLDAGDIRTMIKDMLATDLCPAGLVEFLEKHAEGNPFFVTEYLRTLVQGGVLRHGASGWELTRYSGEWLDTIPSLSLPDALRRLFEMRLEGLSGAAMRILELAAVLGRQFQTDVLESIVTRTPLNDPEAVALALDELVASQIFEFGPNGQLLFVHDKLREAVRLRTSIARSSELHRHVADSIEHLRPTWVGDSPLATDAELGLHWSMAGDPVRALEHLERAAVQAERTHATQQATDLYRLALKQAEHIQRRIDDEASGEVTGDPEKQGSGAPKEYLAADERPRLAESLADLLARSAQHEEARAIYDQALIMLPLGRSMAAARVLRKTAQSFWTIHRYDDAFSTLDDAEARLGNRKAFDSELYREWIEIQQNRFWALYFGRRTGQATVALLDRLAGPIMKYGTPLQRCVFYQCAAMDLLGRNRYLYLDEAVSFAKRAVEEVASKPRFTLERSVARFQVGFALALGEMSHCNEAVEVLSQVVRDASRVGDATLLSRAQTYLAVALRRLGDVDGTEAAARQASLAAEAAQLFPYVGAAAGCAGWVAWKRGDLQRARSEAAAAFAWWSRSPHAFPFRWLADLTMLDIQSSTDDFEAAFTILGDLLNKEQQIFPAALQTALERAWRSCTAESPSETGQALQSALRIAQELGYM